MSILAIDVSAFLGIVVRRSGPVVGVEFYKGIRLAGKVKPI
jgi:hypothetical protein